MPSALNRMSVVLPLLAVVMVLGACSTARDIGNGMSKGFENLGRDISAMFDEKPEGNEANGSGIYDDRYYNSGYDQLATEMSDTNVQLYDFDGNEALAKPQERENRIVRGMGTNDPSVTVFSLDDGTPVERGFHSTQSTRDYNARHGNYEAPPRSPSTGFADREGAFMPMARKTTPQRGREDDVSQFSTMPHRIYFSHDSTALTSSGHEVINHIAKAYQGQNLSVEGHASERAEQEKTVERKITNLKVSMDRALSASRALIHKGVPADAIETKAYGDTKPPLASQGMSPEAAARRVEIYSR